MPQVREQIRRESSPFFKASLLGFVPNKGVFDLYRTQPFHYFINLSASEGLPVSMMEAASCGIPIIGTDVGGVREIIEEGQTGFLVPSSASLEQVLMVLEKALRITQTEHYRAMRRYSRRMFLQRFNAQQNYKQFLEFLGTFV